MAWHRSRRVGGKPIYRKATTLTPAALVTVKAEEREFSANRDKPRLVTRDIPYKDGVKGWRLR